MTATESVLQSSLISVLEVSLTLPNPLASFAEKNFRAGLKRLSSIAFTAWFDAIRLEDGASHSFNTYDTNGNYLTEVQTNNRWYGYDVLDIPSLLGSKKIGKQKILLMEYK